MNGTTNKIESRLSLERIEAASRSIASAFLNTPQFLSETLSEQCSSDLILKVETVNPIRSFKGRGADFFVSNVTPNSNTLVCASTGNFGQAIAYSARKRKFRVIVFAAQSANSFHVQCMRALGAEVRLGGQDFDEAKEFAQAYARQHGGCFVEDGRDVAISEGAGTIGLELCRWPRPINFVLIPLGNGALLSGIGRWIKSKSPMTRIIGVCTVGAQAMQLSWREGKPVSTKSASTIADGLAVRVPIPEVLTDLKSLVDEVLLVDDETLIRAMQLLFVYHGLVTEPAGVAGLAAALAFKHRFQNSIVATPICGGNLSPDRIRRWLLPAT
jgi:threonine dehydratase